MIADPGGGGWSSDRGKRGRCVIEITATWFDGRNDTREDRDRWRVQAEAAQRQLTGHDRRSWWRRMVGS